MLGEFNASLSLQDLNNGYLLGFWFPLWQMSPRFLEDNRRKFETRLNGETSVVFSSCCLNQSTCSFVLCKAKDREFFPKFSLIDSSSENFDESTRKNPVPSPIAPRQLPGVYMILCLVNNKRYYGESKNVSARLSQHKSRLRRTIHEIPDLQNDFNLYGEQSFRFSAVFLSKHSTLEERRTLEIQLIDQLPDLCYNKFSKPSREKENNPFWGRKHSDETIAQMSRSQSENRQNRIPEGFAILLNGVIYPSISEASRQTTHSRDTIRRWLNDPKNKKCVAVNASQRRESMPDIQVANTGVAKPVSLYGVVYPSLAEAARQRNCSRSNIQRLLRSFPTDCFILEED